jgi:hypothetical protein
VLSFTFEGTHAGTFSATGTWPFDPSDPRVLYATWFAASHPEFVVASFRDHSGEVQIEARQRREGGGWDRLFIQVPERVTASSTHEVRSASLVLGATGGGESSGPSIADYSTDRAPGGTITFNSVSAERLKGTFALELIQRGEGASLVGAIRTLNGTFDVPIVRNRPWPGPEVGSW